MEKIFINRRHFFLSVEYKQIQIESLFLILTLFFPHIENRSKKDLIQMLVQRGYESDPVKAWKEAQEKVIICRTRHSEKRLKATSKTTNPNPEI